MIISRSPIDAGKSELKSFREIKFLMILFSVNQIFGTLLFFSVSQNFRILLSTNLFSRPNLPNLPNFHFRSLRIENHRLNLDLENSSVSRFWYFSVVEKHHSFQKWDFVKTCQKQFSHCHLVLLQLTKQYWTIYLLSLQWKSTNVPFLIISIKLIDCW